MKSRWLSVVLNVVSTQSVYMPTPRSREKLNQFCGFWIGESLNAMDAPVVKAGSGMASHAHPHATVSVVTTPSAMAIRMFRNARRMSWGPVYGTLAARCAGDRRPVRFAYTAFVHRRHEDVPTRAAALPPMILDSLANASRYAALGPRIARAFEFLARPETARLEPRQPGSQNSLVKPIVGDDIFALVQRYKPKLRREAFWEAHRNYIDVQCMIEGTELMGWAPIELMGVKQPYDAERDFAVFEPQRGGEEHGSQFLTVKPGHFAVFFPHDVHMPGVAVDDAQSGEIKKIVVKVRV